MRVVLSDNVRLKDQALRISVFSIAKMKRVGDDVREAAFCQHYTKSNCWSWCKLSGTYLTGYVTLCPVESLLSNKDKEGKAVPYHLCSWVCAESLLCSLAHFDIIIKGLSIHLE